MTRIPGIPHMRAVRALEKAGFRIAREGKHIVMSDGSRFLTIPRGHQGSEGAQRFYFAELGGLGAFAVKELGGLRAFAVERFNCPWKESHLAR
jgi:hypothetical protein